MPLQSNKYNHTDQGKAAKETQAHTTLSCQRDTTHQAV